MGTYGLNAEEIADAMEAVEVDSRCEGDYTEKEFLLGASKYIARLRSYGASIRKR